MSAVAASSPSAAEGAVFGSSTKHSWIASAIVHCAVCGALATLVIYGHREHKEIVRTSVVEFEAAKRAEPPPPPPSPPPPPRPIARPVPRATTPQPTPQAAPPVAAPPPVIAAPSTSGASDNAMAVGESTQFQGGNVAANGTETAAHVAEPTPAPAPVARGPVQLPENATAPVPLESNTLPEYPADARASGVTATVIARIVVDANGDVARVDILRGHPLFDDVVRASLRTWRYQPAQYDGAPLAVYQIVRIPFRLENL